MNIKSIISFPLKNVANFAINSIISIDKILEAIIIFNVQLNRSPYSISLHKMINAKFAFAHIFNSFDLIINE